APDVLTADDTNFFLNAPLTMSADGLSGPGSFGPFALFTITIGADVLPGTYQGTFQILGGSGGDAQDAIGSAAFEIAAAAAAPEPCQMVFFTAGLMLLACGAAFRGCSRLSSRPATWKAWRVLPRSAAFRSRRHPA